VTTIPVIALLPIAAAAILGMVSAVLCAAHRCWGAAALAALVSITACAALAVVWSSDAAA